MLDNRWSKGKFINHWQQWLFHRKVGIYVKKINLALLNFQFAALYRNIDVYELVSTLLITGHNVQESDYEWSVWMLYDCELLDNVVWERRVVNFILHHVLSIIDKEFLILQDIDKELYNKIIIITCCQNKNKICQNLSLLFAHWFLHLQILCCTTSFLYCKHFAVILCYGSVDTIVSVQL